MRYQAQQLKDGTGSMHDEAEAQALVCDTEVSERNGAGKLEAAQQARMKKVGGLEARTKKDRCWPREVTKPMEERRARWNKERMREMR